MSIWDDAATDIFEHLATVSTYTYVDSGESTSVHARYAETLQLQHSEYDAGVMAKVPHVDILRSELDRDPKRGDKVTISGTTYTIQTELKNDGRFLKVTVTS